jgi:signal transduction histidine kinase/CheY-like chemotaxis protein
MERVYRSLEGLPAAMSEWPASGSNDEDALFACASLLFTDPARSERARRAILHATGPRNFELFGGCLAFIRTAHYLTMLHPEIDTEEDMRHLMRGHEELAHLLLEDEEADRCEMGERLFEELTALRELNERHELEKAKRALEEKDRQKDQFIAVLAHELRNPLGVIRAATDALDLIASSDPRTQRVVGQLDRQATAMARMLDDLLDASRIALGSVSVELERVAVTQLLAEAVDEQRIKLEQRQIRVFTRFPSESCLVRADRVRLRQILDNLLSNAIKFTPAGGSVEIRCVAEAGNACITVKDSGIGFEKTFADRMFEPFVQHDQSRARSSGGLGLGLAIASRLARLQGGSLAALSEGPDRGAVFTLRIPLADVSVATEPALVRRPQQSRQSILLVEDNEDAANSLAQVLHLMGCTVSIARDGVSAIEIARELLPDLILCDIGLPGRVDGFAVGRACHAEASLRGTRLVAVSGYSSQEDHADAKAAGFERLLTKPLTSAELSEIVASVAH